MDNSSERRRHALVRKGWLHKQSGNQAAHETRPYVTTRAVPNRWRGRDAPPLAA